MVIKWIFVALTIFLVGCGHTCKSKAESGISAKFDPYNAARPVHGVEVGLKFIREW